MTRAHLGLALLAIAPCAGSGQIRNVKPKEPAPQFSLKDQHGKVHALRDYRGKPVVLCYLRQAQQLSAKALAAFSKVHSRAAKDGVVFLALRREASPEFKSTFPVLRDDAESFYGSYGLFVLPVTIVLDKEHRLASVFSSFTPDLEENLQVSIDTILGRPRRPPSPAEDSPTHDIKSTLQARLLSAEALLDASRVDEAAAQLEAILKTDARCAQACLLLGEARLRQGRRDQAEALLRKAVALEPGRAKARYLLGRLYEDSARPKEALSAYRAALELLPLK